MILQKVTVILIAALVFAMPGRNIGGEEMSASGKKVLMVIAGRNFRDEEYKEPRQVLEEAGVRISVASSTPRECRGVYGMTVRPDLLLDDANMSNYDGIVFVGGPGSDEYYNNFKAHSLIQEAFETGKVVAAICIAPQTLANAGIIKGKRVTAFSSVKGGLTAAGAIYTGKDTEIDGTIITASGPGAAKEFGRAILKALSAEPSPSSQEELGEK